MDERSGRARIEPPAGRLQHLVPRLLAVFAMVAAAALATAAPAAAHGVAGAEPTNLRTRLLEVTPAVPGVELSVVEAGSRLQLENRSPDEVVVLGFSGEPFLRVGPDGAFENVRSPATYQFAGRGGQEGAIPPSADPAAPPEWRQTSEEPVARWHDHRVHWMGEEDPPIARAEPGVEHVIFPRWTVELDHAGQQIVASGDLVWVPGASPWPWLALAVATGAATLALALRARWTGFAAALVALVAVDVMHAAGAAAESGFDLWSGISASIGSSWPSLVAWVVAALAVRMLLRQELNGIYAAVLAAGVLAVFGGLGDLAVLSRSQVPFGFGQTVGRSVVALTCGLGVGLVVASFVAISRGTLPAPAAEAGPGGAPRRAPV